MSKNPSVRKRVTVENGAAKPHTPAQEVLTIPVLQPTSQAAILGGEIPGEYQRKVSGTPDLVHPPAWVKGGSNPYARPE